MLRFIFHDLVAVPIISCTVCIYSGSLTWLSVHNLNSMHLFTEMHKLHEILTAYQH